MPEVILKRVLKTVSYWHRIDIKTNRIVLSPEITPCIYGQLTFSKVA